ncbi:MAG: tyrosine-type recombinase/integrase [Burkholderiales bacterium]
MLTDREIQTAKPREKLYRLADGAGLCLEVTPTGSRLWRLRYRFQSKEKLLALGDYPAVRGPEARERAAKARATLREGRDPSAERKAEKERSRIADDSFESVARAWMAKTFPALAASTAEKQTTFLERDVFPWLGARPIAELSAPDLLAVLRRVESRGARDVARRIHSMAGRIFRFAVGHGFCTRDPSRDLELRDVLAPVNVRHHASLTDPRDVAGLLRAIDGYAGSFVVRCALRLAPLVFVRPGELRHAEWCEFDLAKSEWRIPAAKMKMREQHLVPLSEQAVAILREIEPLTGSGRYVFPSRRTTAQPISENTLNAALRYLGYDHGMMTSHGFRSTASTLLHELGYPHAVIERQLAHAERNRVSAAYNFAEHLPERRTMMQAWSDYLDALRTGATVTPIRRTA